MKTNKIFRNIHMNEFCGDIVINKIVGDNLSKLNYSIYIKSTKTDLEQVSANSIHLEDSTMEMVILPQDSIDAKPMTFSFIGTWTQFINSIKEALLNINRKEEAQYLKLSLTIDDLNTKHFMIIQSREATQKSFASIMTATDPKYAKAESIIGKVKQLNNDNAVKVFTDYVYNALIEEGE